MDNNFNWITVAIPTFNREKELCDLLLSLSKQTDQRFYVIICDNKSNYDIEKAVNNFRDVFGTRILLHINDKNYGGAVNFGNALSLSQTKWTWLLGDDDIPNENAISIIYQEIGKNDSIDVGCFHFSIYLLSGRPVCDACFSSFQKCFKSIHESNNGHKRIKNLQGDLMFMSNKVYRKDIIEKFNFVSYSYQFTNITQDLIWVEMLLNQSAYFNIVNKNIIKKINIKNQRWTVQNVALGISTLPNLNLSMSKKERSWFYDAFMFKYTYVVLNLIKGIVSPGAAVIIYNSIYRYYLNVFQKTIFLLVVFVCNSDKTRKLFESIINKIRK